MPNKPPAFQFYAKDWLSSPTVKRMSNHYRGIYIQLLAAAWDSDDPGILPLPLEIAAKSAGLDPRSLRDFVAKFPRCLAKVGRTLVSIKLREQWLRYNEISEKRKLAAMQMHSKCTANALQMGGSAVAVAFAPAIESKATPQNPTPVAAAPSTSPRRFRGKEGKDLFRERIAEHFDAQKEFSDREKIEQQRRRVLRQQAEEVKKKYPATQEHVN